MPSLQIWKLEDRRDEVLMAKGTHLLLEELEITPLSASRFLLFCSRFMGHTVPIGGPVLATQRSPLPRWAATFPWGRVLLRFHPPKVYPAFNDTPSMQILILMQLEMISLPLNTWHILYHTHSPSLLDSYLKNNIMG